MGEGRDFSRTPVLRDFFRGGICLLGTFIWAAAYGLTIRFRILPDTLAVGYLMGAIPIFSLLAAAMIFLVRGASQALFGVPRGPR